MMRTQRILTITGLSLAVLLSVAITSAQAGWHHAPVKRVSHASSGGSCGGSSGGSSGHSHGGLIQNVLSSLHQHHWQRHQVYRGHFSSGGSSGGSVYLSRMSRRLYYAPAAVVPTPAKKAKAATEPAKKPAAKKPAAKKPAAKKPAEDTKPADVPKEKESAGEAVQDKATFNVQVPDDARVFINNLATKTPGMNRRYVSHGLETGFRYSYQIRAEVTRNGKLIQEIQTVQLEAGQTRNLDFKVLDKPVAVVTTLILHVPQGARVTLAGKPLPDGNETRTFQTRQLVAGETWTDYPIQVTYQQDGRTKQIQRNVTLKAGSTHEIKLASDPTRVVNLR